MRDERDDLADEKIGMSGAAAMRGACLTRRSFVRLAGATAVGAALGGAVLPLSGCAPAGDVLRVGTKIDVPGFGFQNPETGSVEGLEVDVARELAARLKGDANALEIVGVNVTTRGAMLDNGTLDATLATFTITDARKKTYDFSRPYYIDHIGVLVLKKSGITDLAGLDGKTVGVALSATTKDKLGAAAAEAGITLKFAEYATYPEIKIALVAGRVDAFSVDSSILLGYQDDTTYLLPTQFAPQEYGVATKKGSEYSAPIDEAIAAMEADGTLAGAEGALGLVAGNRGRCGSRAERRRHGPGGGRSGRRGRRGRGRVPMTEIFAPYKWEALFARWPDILAAFGMTAAISALALVIALVLGFVFGVFAVSRFRILRALTRVYVETVQNIPLLLQVFVLYAVFPLLGLTIASFWIGVIAIGAYHGGYMSEVVRSGIGSVHRGQFEAAKSQGFSPVQTMTLIILPQAMRIILPPLAVQAANLVKNTSVLALIAGGELMYFANSFAGDTSYYGPAYVAAAVLYFAICFPLSRGAVYLEHRMGAHRHVATGDATEELAADAVEVTPGTHDITGHAAAQAMAAGVTTMVEGTSTLVPPVADKGRYLTYAELYGIDAPAWPDRRTVAPRTPRNRRGLARVRGAIGRTGGRRRGKGRRGGRK